MSNMIVTGTSIIALKYKHGVMMAADMKVSYGNYSKFQNVQRLMKINNKTVMGFSGELSDAQYLHHLLLSHSWENISDADDKYEVSTPELYHNYVSKIFYSRKNKVQPLYNTLVFAGLNSHEYDDNDQHALIYSEKDMSNVPYKDIRSEDLYIGFIDMHGTSFCEDYMTTGYGRYFALTLLRSHYKPNMTEEEAKELLLACLKILYLRDTDASNKVQIVKITNRGVEYEEPTYLDVNWNMRDFVYPSTLLPYSGCFW